MFGLGTAPGRLPAITNLRCFCPGSEESRVVPRVYAFILKTALLLKIVIVVFTKSILTRFWYFEDLETCTSTIRNGNTFIPVNSVAISDTIRQQLVY